MIWVVVGEVLGVFSGFFLGVWSSCLVFFYCFRKGWLVIEFFFVLVFLNLKVFLEYSKIIYLFLF